MILLLFELFFDLSSQLDHIKIIPHVIYVFIFKKKTITKPIIFL
jgi:hypothetical protein